MKGYQGKILRVNLTDRKSSTLDPSKYAEYVGGHGMASAIFWDLCKDKTVDGFDPGNVVSIMSSPISGTITPSGSGRCELTGIGVQSSPIGWYTRSNFGGRFVGMMKYAGLDGIVLEGKADKPVWLDIVNDKVTIRDAGPDGLGLWGLDTYETQEKIWEYVNKAVSKEGWRSIDDSARDAGNTTQKPAVLTIGPAGESLSRMACLIHDAGNGAGQGGFGGVWGSKNLKAISILGTGGVKPDDPNALIEARINAKEGYGTHLESIAEWDGPLNFADAPNAFDVPKISGGRAQSCQGCIAGCRARWEHGYGNESACIDSRFYREFNKKKFGKYTKEAFIGSEMAQRYGVNVYELYKGLEWLERLYNKGILGKGKQIDFPLNFEELGTAKFAEDFMRAISERKGVFDDIAEGFYRAAERWGLLDEGLKTGELEFPYWGCPEHGYDARAEVEWGFSSILSDRDANEHDFNFLYWMPTIDITRNHREPFYKAEHVVNVVSKALVPYENNPDMLDYSDGNIYSENIVKLVAWHRHYTRFYKQSVLFCDWRWPNLFNTYTPGNVGLTGDQGEPKFLNAITGGNLTFKEGMELGRKIWYLDNAIYTLQGRHRDIVHFADYIYNVPFAGGFNKAYYMPGKKDGKWDYLNYAGRKLDRDKFEEWKTKYYKFEGWDTETGWPTRSALEDVGLKHVADELEKNDKLGNK
jgi:aldehyde:ferredoxin oxidoreductase